MKRYESLLDRRRRIAKAFKQEVDKQAASPSSYKVCGQIRRMNELKDKSSQEQEEIRKSLVKLAQKYKKYILVHYQDYP